MTRRVVIVGGGIIGAAAAYQLSKAGAEVLVIDAGLPGATAASFGWLNASFYHSAAHFRLRAEGLAAYDRLASDLDIPVRMIGCLSTEFGGERLKAEAESFRQMGYPVEEVSAEQYARLEPHVAPQGGALRFPGEGIAEPVLLSRALLDAAGGQGARKIAGVSVTGFQRENGRISGVATTAQHIPADEVLVSAGTATEALLATAGFALPMVPRPAYVIETCPVRPVLTHVLATPDGELRQRPDGALVMPAAVSHQGDSAETVTMTPIEAAEATTARIRALLPKVEINWAAVRLAHRPMPADGLPAVGRIAPGLTVAAMHSGMTLAAIIGECLAREVLQGPSNVTEKLLGDFRPTRFT